MGAGGGEEGVPCIVLGVKDTKSCVKENLGTAHICHKVSFLVWWLMNSEMVVQWTYCQNHHCLFINQCYSLQMVVTFGTMFGKIQNEPNP